MDPAEAGTAKAGTGRAGTGRAGTAKAGTAKAGTAKAGTAKAATARAAGVFDALGEPVRRRILELLAGGEQPVGSLVTTLRSLAPISQPAVSQHLKVLLDAGLVSVRAAGTRRLYALDTAGLGAARAWLEWLAAPLAPFDPLAQPLDPLAPFAQPLDALATEVARGRRVRGGEAAEGRRANRAGRAGTAGSAGTASRAGQDGRPSAAPAGSPAGDEQPDARDRRPA